MLLGRSLASGRPSVKIEIKTWVRPINGQKLSVFTMSGYIFLKIIIIFNVIIVMSLISYSLFLKKNKKYLYSIIKLAAIPFIIQTVLIIGLNSKEFNFHVTIIAELVYLIYFIYQVKKTNKMYLSK